MNSSWPMKCHDLHHTSRSPYNADDGGGLEKWRFNCKPVYGSLVIDTEDDLYFGERWDYFYSINSDGGFIWNYEIDWIWSTPAIASDGTLYVSSYDAKLYALYPNGTQRWNASIGGSSSSSPVIGLDGTIYVGHQNNDLVAINPDGMIKWIYSTGAEIVSDPAIGDDDTIYIGSLDDYFYAINPNGTLKWRFKTGDWIKSHPAIADDGTIYINSFDNYLYALNPNGTMKWKVDDCGNAGSPALGADGMIYTGNQHLYGIYPNGTIKWSIPLDLGHSSPALSADGVLYVGIGKSIVAVDSTDGTELWRKHIANVYIGSSPVIDENGVVYIGSASSKVFHDPPFDIVEDIGYIHAFGPAENNSPPHDPVVTGKSFVEKDGNQYLLVSAIDPDLNPLTFYIDWGDGAYTNWSGGGWGANRMPECGSDETVSFKHCYSEVGTYTVRVKTRDVLGEESEWTSFTFSVYQIHIAIQNRGLYPLCVARNIGTNTLSDIPWEIRVNWDFFHIFNWIEGKLISPTEPITGTIESLQTFQTKRLRSPVVGLGPIKIRFIVGETEIEKHFFTIGPFIFPYFD